MKIRDLKKNDNKTFVSIIIISAMANNIPGRQKKGLIWNKQLIIRMKMARDTVEEKQVKITYI